MKKFNMLIETVDLDAKVGYLFLVYTNFNLEKANAKTLMYNEIYTSIFEKQKILDPTEKAVFQPSEIYEWLTKGLCRLGLSRRATLLCLKIIYTFVLRNLSFLI